MERDIHIRAELIYQSKGNNTHLRAEFPRERWIGIVQGLQIYLNSGDPHLMIKVRALFHEKISERRYEAFEKCLLDGTVINIGSAPSPKIESFLTENIKKWATPGRKFFEILRWMYNSYLDDSGTHHEFSWSLDGITFQPFTTVEIGEGYDELYVSATNPMALTRLMANPMVREPDYFKILREAESNLEENPKSALIVMVVALEISMKRLLIRKKPEMKEVFNGKYPPSLEEIFFRLLPQEIPELIFNSKSYELFKNLIKNRNDLVHQGIYTLSRTSLLKRFRFVSDVLYILDFHRGIVIFGQAFYEFEQRLAVDHKREFDPGEGLGHIDPSSRFTIRFHRRYWQI